MALKINFTYLDKDYHLEFTRESAKTAERMGFNMDEIASKPMTMIPLIFFCSFIAHHSNIKKQLTDEIYGTVPDKSQMIKSLCEMFDETRASLIADMEDSEGNEGNLVWEMSR